MTPMAEWLISRYQCHDLERTDEDGNRDRFDEVTMGEDAIAHASVIEAVTLSDPCLQS